MLPMMPSVKHRRKFGHALHSFGGNETGVLMLGLMQNRPLLISNLVDYVATWHAETEIVSRDPAGLMHRSNYGQVVARAKRVANALAALGVGQDDRVATLAWNSWRPLELYYGVPSSGPALHTPHPPPSPPQPSSTITPPHN